MSVHEAAGVQLVPAPRKNLPNRILRAFDNAKHLQGLKRSVRDTLAELCRFVPQNRPFETVFAHKATIAQRIGMSERTLYRHLGALEEAELIETMEQDRKSRNGRFAVARIRLTRKAAALLGFIEAPEEQPFVNPDDSATNTPEDPALPCCTNRDIDAAPAGQNTHDSPVIHSPPSAILSDRHTLSVPTVSKHQLPQRTENGLPIDLAWLTRNGVSRAGIFCLMGLAKAKQKRLSDIVTVVEQRIRELKGSALFAYLAALCKGPTDFSAAAATERARVRAERLANEFKRKAAVFRERFKGVSLTNPGQTLLVVIDRRCAFAQVFNVGKTPSTMPLHDLKPMIERVEAGQLVMATLALERQFGAA